MILSIGADLIDIRRIEETLERFGTRFERRIFSETERAKAARRKNAGKRVIAATYARRFAAKEACAKALGTGMMQGVRWQDIEVVNAPGGAPTLILHGRALARLSALAPAGHRPMLHLSLTDEYPYAQATVVLSAETL